MTDLHRKGQRICGALSLFLTFSLPAFAQDLRLPLLQGQPDLALFALSRSESEISAPGRFLLERQGFYHRPGAGLQTLTSGLSLSPTLRHDPNINDGIPADRVTLGGLPFIVAPESRAKEAFNCTGPQRAARSCFARSCRASSSSCSCSRTLRASLRWKLARPLITGADAGGHRA